MSVDMKLFQEKKERVIKTIQRKEVDKPSFMFVGDGYYPYYAGVEKSSVTTFEKAAEVVVKVANDLQYDTTIFPFMPANLTVSPTIELLGGGCFVVKDFTKMQSPEKVEIMEPEEYPELIKDPTNYLLENVLPRRYSLLESNNNEDKFNKLIQLLQETQKVGEYVQSCEEQGAHTLFNRAMIAPMDYIFDFFREFNGIVRDVKRSPDLVKDASLAILEAYKPIIKTFQPIEDKAIFVPMHIPAFLKPKDFEKTYWPSFKEFAEFMAGLGHNVAYYFEKKYEHLFDYLQELPKKGVIGIFQEDDMKLTKQKLGNTMAIAGGLSTAIMQHGTKEECIDHVKELIDNFCPGGGYFIAPDTPMMFPVDAKPENLKVIADYIRDYRF